jgi:hypothetical protein
MMLSRLLIWKSEYRFVIILMYSIVLMCFFFPQKYTQEGLQNFSFVPFRFKDRLLAQLGPPKRARPAVPPLSKSQLEEIRHAHAEAVRKEEEREESAKESARKALEDRHRKRAALPGSRCVDFNSISLMITIF